MDDFSDSDMELFIFSSNSSTDDNFMEEMKDEASMMFYCALAASSSFNLFYGSEWEEGGFQSVNPHEGVRDVLTTMRSTPSLFKSNTNFTLQIFDELCLLVVPVTIANAHSTGQNRISPGRPSKLSSEQHILNFFLYLSMTTLRFWTHSCGIGPKVSSMIILFFNHRALTKHCVMKSSGQV